MVREGDALIGLPSTGLHTNGYSLARKLFFEELGMDADTWVDELGKSVADELLTPHKNYLPSIRPLLSTGFLHGMAHITGGGIPGNLNRALPDDLDARVDSSAWETPAVFEFIREQGRIENQEMFKAFNMGIGMILIVRNSAEEQVLSILKGKGEEPVILGDVVKGSGKVILS